MRTGGGSLYALTWTGFSEAGWGQVEKLSYIISDSLRFYELHPQKTIVEKEYRPRTSLAVQWLRIHASTAGGTGLMPGWGTKILYDAWCGQK